MGKLQKYRDVGLSSVQNFPTDTQTLLSIKKAAFKKEVTQTKTGMILLIPALGMGVFVYMAWCTLWLKTIIVPFVNFIFQHGMDGGTWITLMFLSIVGFLTLPTIGLLSLGYMFDEKYNLWGNQPKSLEAKLAGTLLEKTFLDQYILSSENRQNGILVKLEKQKSAGIQNYAIKEIIELNQKETNQQLYGIETSNGVFLNEVNPVFAENKEHLENSSKNLEDETVQEVFLDCSTPDKAREAQKIVEQLKQNVEELNQQERQKFLQNLQQGYESIQVQNLLTKQLS